MIAQPSVFSKKYLQWIYWYVKETEKEGNKEKRETSLSTVKNSVFGMLVYIQVYFKWNIKICNLWHKCENFSLGTNFLWYLSAGTQNKIKQKNIAL